MNASLNTVVADISRKIKEQEEERIAQDTDNSNIREALRVRCCAACELRFFDFCFPFHVTQTAAGVILQRAGYAPHAYMESRSCGSLCIGTWFTAKVQCGTVWRL